MEGRQIGRLGTIDMVRGSKRDLFEQNHPVIRLLREIPQIVFTEGQEEILSRGISLKKLFTRKEMDRRHVDCLVLYQIADRVLEIMEELSKRHICPGLYDLNDLYVDMNGGYALWLLHPERFQLLSYEQDYEWYPEDERLFGDGTLFDPGKQQLADTRLIYKILTASTKGNVKIPPRMTEADYSELFYKTLPEEWRQIFEAGEGCAHGEMRALLKECIDMEKACAREARERLNDQAKKEAEEKRPLSAGEGKENLRPFYDMFVILRTEPENSRQISRLLYQEQDRIEMEEGSMGRRYYQAFVYGDGVIHVKDFAMYGRGYRCQFEQAIREYPASEAVLIGAELMEDAMKQKKEAAGFRIYFLADGSLKNDRMFRYALEKTEKLGQAGCEIRFLFEEKSKCEACQKLYALAGQFSEERQTRGAGYDKGNSDIS